MVAGPKEDSMNRLARRTTLVLGAVGILAMAGCDKGGSSGGPAGSASAAASGAPKPTAAASSAAPASNLPVKGPWEAIKITFCFTIPIA